MIPASNISSVSLRLPGDTITVTATNVCVDNVKLNEPYIYPLAPGEFGSRNILNDVKLKPGQYFVLGDHRDNSTDSRVFGPVPAQNIIGKAEFVFWPFGSIHMIDSYHNVFQNVHPSARRSPTHVGEAERDV